MVVAIHQPNFFPWLGFFDKIRRANIFIFIDDVQFAKTGGTWSNRVKVLINGEGRWLTAPVDRNYHGTRKINEMTFFGKEDWRGKVLKTLTSAYRNASHFEESYSLIEPLISYPEDNVAEYNIHAIKAMASALGYPVTSLVRSSDFPTEFSGTHRLIELTKRVDGESYLCGGGAAGYQEDAAFQEAGIRLIHQNFTPRAYVQYDRQDFVAGLSILDALMNIGFEGVKKLVHQDER